ncbi:TPA: phage tailspike protein [Escherichia coli]
MPDITPNVVIGMPSQLFTMARSFKAVANGKIYIGKIDTDPVNPENQIQVYVENEEGSHVPVSQPIVINAAGYPVYNGQIAKFVTVKGHSMAVYDAYGTQQFYFPNVLKYDPDQLRQQLEDPDGAKKYPELQIARWRDDKDVRGWGADDSGNRDSTQAFLDAASSAGNSGLVHVPSGEFIVDASKIDISRFSGDGVLISNGVRISVNPPMQSFSIGQRKLATLNFGDDINAPTIYANAQNALQGIACVRHEGIEKVFITQQVGGSNWGTDTLTRISEWHYTSDGSTLYVVTFTEPLPLGHGSDLSATIENGELYLFTTTIAETGSSLGGKGYSKTKWKGASTSAEDITHYRVFGEPGDNNLINLAQRASICVSNDGRYVILIATSNAGTGRFLYVYDRKEVESSSNPMKVRPINGPVPLVRGKGQYGATLQGITSDSRYIYTIWGGVPARCVRTVQIYDMGGTLIRSFPVSLAASLYTETQLNGSDSKIGVPVSFEPEGLAIRGDELVCGAMDVWKSAGDVVSHRGKNWVSIVTGDNKGNLPTNRSYWLKTSLAATSGEWDSGATYKSGDYTRRNKHLFGIANLSDILGNHPVHGAESDPYTGTAHQYYAGTDIAFNREHGSFTIAIFDEAIGEYTKSLELNYGNNLNLFDTDYGHDNNSWVSTKAVFDSNFRGMQFRSKDGNTAGGAYIDIHAADCPSAAGELILASTDGGVVRLKQGNVTVFSATKDTTSTWATTTLRPTTDNQVSLGRSVNRFSQVYAGTATINTSDATEKTEVRTLSDKEQAVGLALVDEIGFYQWLDSVKNKGADARLHAGLTVQRAMEIFRENGLDPFKYGAICYDRWDAYTDTDPAVYDDEGNLVREAITITHEAGERYAFRNDELQYLMIAALGIRQKNIIKRIEELENKLAN